MPFKPVPKCVVRAFTLIEMLVVVAVIALLVSVLLPSLQNARKQAAAVACASNSKQIYMSLHMYQNDHKGYLPWTLWSEYDWDFRPNDAAPKSNLWFYKLFPKYLKDPNALVCPGDPFRNQFDFKAVRKQRPPRPEIWYANIPVPSCGYALNYLFRHFTGGHPKRPAYNMDAHAPKRPGNTILMAEVGPDDRLANAPLGQGEAQPWRDGGRLVWDDGARSWYSGPTWLTARHLGRINMVAIDGTVQRVPTVLQLQTRLRSGPYADCERGGCYFCIYEKSTPHYNFAPSKLYWWTGKPVFGP